jgi:hypothetical protein
VCVCFFLGGGGLESLNRLQKETYHFILNRTMKNEFYLSNYIKGKAVFGDMNTNEILV